MKIKKMIYYKIVIINEVNNKLEKFEYNNKKY